MYCKRCKTLLQNGSHICKKCGLDNDATIDLSDCINDIKQKKKDNKANLPFIIIFIFIISALISFYFIKSSYAHSENEKLIIPTTTKTPKELKEYIYEDIILEYPDNFEVSNDSLFYNNNELININIKTITSKEYSDLINGNECLDSKIGMISSKTFAGNNYYSHIFMINYNYYNLTVNYIEDINIYNEKVQLDIAKIINSIKQK